MGDIHSMVEVQGNFKIIQFIPGTILPLVVTLVTSSQVVGEYNKLFEVPFRALHSSPLLFYLLLLHFTTALRETPLNQFILS